MTLKTTKYEQCKLPNLYFSLRLRCCCLIPLSLIFVMHRRASPVSSSEIRKAWTVHQCHQMTAQSPFQHCSSYTILYQALLRDSRTQFWQRQMWNQLTWWAWSLTRRVCTRVLRGWMFEFRWGHCSCSGVYCSNYHHFISYASID